MHTETSPLGRVIRSGLIPLNFQRDKSVHSAPFAYIGRERLGKIVRPRAAASILFGDTSVSQHRTT